jgi:hypothetical protein
LDVVHLSGHGLPAGLLLENDVGRRDLISRTDLVDLLDLCADQIKLVTLSACESAAVTASENLQMLGLLAPAVDPATRTDHSPGSWLPSMAAALVARLDCAVLAMRYPVEDDFAIALARSFYDLLLGKGQPVSRALVLTLPRVPPEPQTPRPSALSLATPVLFGARASDLKLVPPTGGPVVFEAEDQKLAGFPAQPERFVGRVGAMTRATAVLAPRSGTPGILLHGMAGVGKTACALELAYGHQDSFARMAWHAAPPEGDDITAALTDFTLALERQLPGLKLMHLVSDIAMLRDHLPPVTEWLERNRVLIVLDNIESLLSEGGDWRDERWGLLIDALTAHRGLSRLVLTSRRRPAHLDAAVLVEPVHALSLQESVLLAREWPRLRRLIDGVDLPDQMSVEAARGLVSHTLAMVQGHPKLIELAEGYANDPAALTARLAEANETWLTHGTRLDAFMGSGESGASDEEYLAVLQTWTRSTMAALPEASAVLFRFLACLEEEDRIGPVIDGTWPEVWRRLGRHGAPPDLDAAAVPLIEHAVVAAEFDSNSEGVSYRIHPGVAEAARGAADAFSASVDAELADFWLVQLGVAEALESDHEMGRPLLRAAHSAAPYLLRLHRWADLGHAAEALLVRARDSATAAALLPMLSAALDTIGGTDLDLALSLGRNQARALAVLGSDQAVTKYRQLLNTAVDHQRFDMGTVLAGDLISLYLRRGWLDDALDLADKRVDYTRRAGRGPWSQLGDQAQRLHVLYAQGHYRRVLDTGQRLREQMAGLPDPPHDDPSNPWNVREMLLSTIMAAATQEKQWQLALDVNSEVRESKRGRGAPMLEQATTAFNEHGALLHLGRISDARELLIGCRQVFEESGDVRLLGATLGALADVEYQLDHIDRALDLQREALQYAYLTMERHGIATSHLNFAIYLDRAGAEPQPIVAHRLAAAVIFYQTSHDGSLNAMLAYTGHLLALEAAAVPVSFAELCRIVEEVPGVQLANLAERIPDRARDSQSALDQVLNLAAQADGGDITRLITERDNVLSALRTSLAHPDPETRSAARRVLDLNLPALAQYRPELTAVLRRIHAGERDADVLLPGLERIDRAITQRALAYLAGDPSLGIDPDAWLALRNDTDEAEDKSFEAGAAMIVAARGDTEIRRFWSVGSTNLAKTLPTQPTQLPSGKSSTAATRLCRRTVSILPRPVSLMPYVTGSQIPPAQMIDDCAQLPLPADA